MVKVNEDVNGNPLPCELYLDGVEKENLDHYNKKRNLDWDIVGAVVGLEGDGKSVYTAQRCLYMDHRFNINNIVFTEEQFYEAVDDEVKFPDGSCIMWDEADAAAEHFASKMIRALTKKFKRIRKRRLAIFLVTPTFFDMNRYFAVHRLRFLIEVYSEGLQRGYFNFFSAVGKRLLYFEGKKYWNMQAVRPSFKGRFTKLPKGFPVDFGVGGEYDRKKDEATKQINGDVVSSDKLSSQDLKVLETEIKKRLAQRIYDHVSNVEKVKQILCLDYKTIRGCIKLKDGHEKFASSKPNILTEDVVEGLDFGSRG